MADVSRNFAARMGEMAKASGRSNVIDARRAQPIETDPEGR